jgi:hypothetical protein
MAIKTTYTAGIDTPPSYDADGNLIAPTQTPATLAAALRAQQTPAPQPMQQQFFNAPTGDGKALLDLGLSGKPVGSNFEGVGRMAQIVSGSVLQGRERDAENTRHRAAAEHIGKHMGAEWGQQYALSDQKGRDAIMTSSREYMAKAQADARELKRTKEGAALLQGVSGARDLEDRLLGSNNAEFIKRGMDAKLKRLEAEAGPQVKVEYKDGVMVRTHKITGEVISVEEPKLSRPAAGPSATPATPNAAVPAVPSADGKAAPTAGPDGKPVANERLSATHPDHVDSWETATTPSRQKAAYDHALKAHDINRKAISEGAQTAARGMTALTQVEAALNRGAQTGSMAEYGLQIRKMGNALGLEFGKGASDQEIISATANELAKGARAGYPGSVSNFEMQTYLRSVPSLSNTPEGNRLLIDGMRRMLQRQIDTRDVAQQYIRERQKGGKEGMLAEGFDSYLSAHNEAKPLYSKAEVEAMSKPGYVPGKQPAQSRVEQLDAKRGQSTFPAPPAAAIEMLKSDPSSVEMFEKTFGPGSSLSVLQQPGAAGFSRPISTQK